MMKVQAEPDGDPRWVGNGRTVVNNKGAVIKQYEPYFSDTEEYEDEDDIVATGVTPIMTYDALGRLLRTDLPNGTWSRVVFTPWYSESWDPNDTVTETGNIWYADRDPGGGASDEEKRAAVLAAAHAETPSISHFDSLGRPYKVIVDTGSEEITTKSVMDLEGQVLTVVDGLGRDALIYTYAIGGACLREVTLDSGESRGLPRVTGTPAVAWDARDHKVWTEYDDLERLTHLWVKLGAGDPWLANRVFYGEAETTPETNNLRGRAVLAFDGAGVVETSSFDFKGNALSVKRTLATTYTSEPDWSDVSLSADLAGALSDAGGLLEGETWEKTFAFDALNRLFTMTTPDGSIHQPSYNEASLLDGVVVDVRGGGNADFVTNIDYDEKGRRTRIDYANYTFTEYTYDPLTFRLTRVLTKREDAPGLDDKTLQDLRYTYDPVGNVVQVNDEAHQDVYYDNSVVTPDRQFEYDAIYRLVSAKGREQSALVGGQIQRDQLDVILQPLPHPDDPTPVRLYEESWVYDEVGNILDFVHHVPIDSSKDWTRRYMYGSGLREGYADNRLHSTSAIGDDPEGPYTYEYEHDENGNITVMPHLSEIEYTHRNQMRHADLGGGGDAYYAYGAGGERVLKRIDTGSLIKERIYLGGWELYRERDTSMKFERETLHVMDDVRRIAMVETKTWEAYTNITDAEERRRWQYDDHLGSACVEVDEGGAVISYEEYHPYGTCAYRSGTSGMEVPEKRYRYTGKERDDETGFQENHWRYYAPWLGRWTGADPVRGLGSAYEYCGDSPVCLVDPNGMQPTQTMFLTNQKSAEKRLRSVWGNGLYWDATKGDKSGWYVQTQGKKILSAKGSSPAFPGLKFSLLLGDSPETLDFKGQQSIDPMLNGMSMGPVSTPGITNDLTGVALNEPAGPQWKPPTGDEIIARQLELGKPTEYEIAKQNAEFHVEEDPYVDAAISFIPIVGDIRDIGRAIFDKDAVGLGIAVLAIVAKPLKAGKVIKLADKANDIAHAESNVMRMAAKKPPNQFGSLGKPSTRKLNADIATELEKEGFVITGGGGRMKEEYIPGPGGGRKGSARVDITGVEAGDKLRVQTTDTLVRGGPDSRELRNAGKILKQILKEGGDGGVVLVPKLPIGVPKR